MEPLDLRIAPPRPPRAELAGIVFLPRSIDKVRAALPGGSLRDYEIEGFTTQMLEHLGISLDEFIAVVRDVSTDDAVATYVAEHADAKGADAWREYILARKPFNGDRVAAVAEFPYLAERTDIIYSLDLLAEDDRRAFLPT